MLAFGDAQREYYASNPDKSDMLHYARRFLRTNGKRAGRQIDPRVRVEYQVSQAIFVRAIGEYFADYTSELFDDSRTGYPLLQVLRGLLLVTSTLLNFIAIMYLQLAQTAAIFFSIPLWVCALSVPILGEKVGLRRWIAVAIGFCGVLVIMRPGTGSFHWAMLLSIAASLCGAIYNIVTRKVGGRDRAETSLFYVGFVGALAAAAPLPFVWKTPEGLQWVMLGFMGLAGTIGHFMLIQAHRLAPASVLAPYMYTQIVWMIAVGYLFFGDVPDLWTLVGAAIVVASGLFVFAGEARAPRAPAAA
jgi:drug/metabolite transporter (DMT)-like permease